MLLDKDTYYYTKKEVAEIFKKTTKTINVWVKEGLLHPDKFGNKKQSPVLFRRTEIESLMNKKNKSGD